MRPGLARAEHVEVGVGRVVSVRVPGRDGAARKAALRCRIEGIFHLDGLVLRPLSSFALAVLKFAVKETLLKLWQQRPGIPALACEQLALLIGEGDGPDALVRSLTVEPLTGSVCGARTRTRRLEARGARGGVTRYTCGRDATVSPGLPACAP